MALEPGVLEALLRGWRCLCPRCGGGDLFATTFRMHQVCPGCSLVTRREDGALTGQMYLSSAITQVMAVGLMVLVYLLTDWPLWISLSVMLPPVVGFCYWSLPRCMATWVAVEYLTDRSSEEPWLG